MNLDKRGLLMGLVTGILATLALAAVTSSGPGPVGKYQLEFSGDGKLAVIDTTTGQVWRGNHQSANDPGWKDAK